MRQSPRRSRPREASCSAAARPDRVPHREPGEGGDAFPRRGAALHGLLTSCSTGSASRSRPGTSVPRRPSRPIRRSSRACRARAAAARSPSTATSTSCPSGTRALDARPVRRRDRRRTPVRARRGRHEGRRRRGAVRGEGRARAGIPTARRSRLPPRQRRGGRRERQPGVRRAGARAPTHVSVEPTELALSLTEGGLVHFRIEVEGVEAHAGTRYLSVHAGGGAAAASTRSRRCSRSSSPSRSSSGSGRTRSRIRSCRPATTRCCRGSSSAGPAAARRAAQPLLERGHDAELLLGRVQPLVLPGRDARGRARRGRGRTCGRLRDRPVAARAPAPVHLGLDHIYFPPLDVPPDHPAVRRCSPAASGRRRRAGAEGFGAATDLAWYAERGSPGSSAAPAGSRSATSPTSTWTPSSSCSRRRATRDVRRVVRVAGRGLMRALVYTLERTLDVLDVEAPAPARARCSSASSAPGSAAATSRVSRREARAERRR